MVRWFIHPVNIITPINTMSTPPIFTVYLTTFLCLRNSSSRVLVNSPTAKNGSTNPKVYTPISTKPCAAWAEVAISSTLAKVGPTQGVQAKLKVKPRIRATRGFIATLSKRKGSRASRFSSLEEPNSPSWYSPNRMTITPPTRPRIIRFSRKNCPAAVKPNPSRKNAKLMPSTKNRVLQSTLLRL